MAAEIHVWILSEVGRQVTGDYYCNRFCRRFLSVFLYVPPSVVLHEVVATIGRSGVRLENYNHFVYSRTNPLLNRWL
jgi:hypothetical protein